MGAAGDKPALVPREYHFVLAGAAWGTQLLRDQALGFQQLPVGLSKARRTPQSLQVLVFVWEVPCTRSPTHSSAQPATGSEVAESLTQTRS